MTSGAPSTVASQGLEAADFDYDLPRELIAQRPLARRDDSRLMVLEKETGVVRHSQFNRLGEWLQSGDLLVANNSRVIPARLRGLRQPFGGAVEVLLLRKSSGLWSALAKPAKRLSPGTTIEFPALEPGCSAAIGVVEWTGSEGEIRLRFQDDADGRLEHYGITPLPPYITEPLEDSSRYQTVFASAAGSAAAPTAGLHFTESLIEQLWQRSIEWAEVTLHVGLDTFRPITAPRIVNHRIHREWCEVPIETARAIAACQKRGGRIVAVGTTAARTLETLGQHWNVEEPAGLATMTDVMIVPGHRWQLVDALVTNFHLPRSTLLMLVSALAGREPILRAYTEAMKNGYRFYSFGDAMLIH